MKVQPEGRTPDHRVDWWRRLRMKWQLLLSFGVTNILVFAIFITIWAISVFSLRDTLISSSKDHLREQIETISSRILTEAADVFEAKMHVGASSFLWPIAFTLFDAYDTDTHYSVLPPRTYLGNQLSGCANASFCLRQPLNTDDRFRCTPGPEPGCTETAGGCMCDGHKRISTGASSLFATGMGGSEAGLSVEGAALLEQERVRLTAHLDPFLAAVWAENPSWIQAFLGISSTSNSTEVSVREAPLLRSYPGSVREGLSDSTAPPPGGRYYDPTKLGWYTQVGHASMIDTPRPVRQALLQTRRPELFLTQPYLDADGKGFLITLTTHIQTPGGGGAGGGGH